MGFVLKKIIKVENGLNRKEYQLNAATCLFKCKFAFNGNTAENIGIFRLI